MSHQPPAPTGLRIAWFVGGFILVLLAIAGFLFGDQVTGYEHVAAKNKDDVAGIYLLLLIGLLVGGVSLISMSRGDDE